MSEKMIENIPKTLKGRLGSSTFLKAPRKPCLTMYMSGIHDGALTPRDLRRATISWRRKYQEYLLRTPGGFLSVTDSKSMVLSPSTVIYLAKFSKVFLAPFSEKIGWDKKARKNPSKT